MCSEDGSAPTGVMNSVKRSESKCVDYRFKANIIIPFSALPCL